MLDLYQMIIIAFISDGRAWWYSLINNVKYDLTLKFPRSFDQLLHHSIIGVKPYNVSIATSNDRNMITGSISQPCVHFTKMGCCAVQTFAAFPITIKQKRIYNT